MPETLNLTGATQTLDEQFKKGFAFRKGGTRPRAIKALNDPAFSWAAGYVWPHQPPQDPQVWPPVDGKPYPAWSDMGGGTADVVPNADMIERIGAANSPFKVFPGMLSMQAKPMPAALKKTVSPRDGICDYIGAAMTSYPYAQAHGVFAMLAKLPKDNGLWPAFWLLPADLSWPPEIDIMEMLGKDTTTVYQTVHAADIKGGRAGAFHKPGMDLSAGYHEYAADWSRDHIRFYLDRKLISTIPTPPSLRGRPCYLIVGLSVGTKATWPGPVDPKDFWLSEMLVRNVRVWQRPEYA
jgi:beta-glucanase (GH16 family)